MKYRFFKRGETCSLWEKAEYDDKSWICITGSPKAMWNLNQTTTLLPISSYSGLSDIVYIEYDADGPDDALKKISEQCIVELL